MRLWAVEHLQRRNRDGAAREIARIDWPGFLSSAHLQALVAAGDEIGDHAMDHVELSAVIAARVPYEIDAAAARIAQITGYWPESLAYPYGGVNSRVAAAVAACGELRIDRFVVPRLKVKSNTTPATLMAELG